MEGRAIGLIGLVDGIDCLAGNDCRCCAGGAVVRVVCGAVLDACGVVPAAGRATCPGFGAVRVGLDCCKDLFDGAACPVERICGATLRAAALLG